MTEKTKNKIGLYIVGFFVLLVALTPVFKGNNQTSSVSEKPTGQILEGIHEDIRDLKNQKELAKIDIEIKKQELKRYALENDLDVEKVLAEYEAEKKANSSIEDGPKLSIELSEVAMKEEKKKAEVKPTSFSKSSFRLNNGKIYPFSKFRDECFANKHCFKMQKAFRDKYGDEVADKVIMTMKYENGTFKPDTVGVCSRKYQIGGDYRNCNYADKNSAGMDVGLIQVNTFYQAKRITKLGGPSCTFGNSKDRKDPCNEKKIAWLINVDNNIKVALDIYSEQGLSPWYGYKRAVSRKV